MRRLFFCKASKKNSPRVISLVLQVILLLILFVICDHLVLWATLISVFLLMILYPLLSGVFWRCHRATIYDNDIELQIVDETDHLFEWKYSKRMLIDGRGGIYSAISFNCRHQPCLKTVQEICDLWFTPLAPPRALILGCAGCAIPRYIIMTFEKTIVTGVELSPELIRVARKYFLDGIPPERFNLLNDDAENFIKNYNEKCKFSIVFSDLFCGNHLVEDIYTESFFAALSKIIDKGGLLIINAGGISPERMDMFYYLAAAYFDWCTIFSQSNQSNHLYLVCSPAPNSAMIDAVLRTNDKVGFTAICSRRKQNISTCGVKWKLAQNELAEISNK